MRAFLLVSLGICAAACNLDSSLFGDPGLGAGGALASTGIGGGFSAAVTSSVSSMSSTGSTGGSSMSSSTGSTSGGGASSTTGGGGAPSTTGGGAVCGDGVVSGEEQCDDSNTAAMDGCGPTCLVEGSANQCPSGAVIKVAQQVTIVGTTTGKQNVVKTTCGGTSAGDMVYQVVPGKTAPLTVELTTSAVFDRILAVRPTCNSDASTLVCTDQNTLLSYTVQNATAGVPFHVVISGHGGSVGDFTLRLKF